MFVLAEKELESLRKTKGHRMFYSDNILGTTNTPHYSNYTNTEVITYGIQTIQILQS
jgi:hypothetical protein